MAKLKIRTMQFYRQNPNRRAMGGVHKIIDSYVKLPQDYLLMAGSQTCYNKDQVVTSSQRVVWVTRSEMRTSHTGTQSRRIEWPFKTGWTVPPYFDLADSSMLPFILSDVIKELEKADLEDVDDGHRQMFMALTRAGLLYGIPEVHLNCLNRMRIREKNILHRMENA